MRVPNVRRAGPCAAAALLVATIACTTRDQAGGSTGSAAAVRGDSVARRPGDPPLSPSTPQRDTGAQRRDDGSMLNPPIHRTNPRDDDIFRPRDSGRVGRRSAADLMAEIRALAKPAGCASAGDCRTLPVGRKACGGPRAYVVFCPNRTDVAALEAKIAELDRADRAAASGAVSDCMMVLSPTVTATGGVCRASPGTP